MDPLKSAWDSASHPHRDISDLQAIIRQHSSPALKSIRQQVIIEAIGYTAFLLVYYDFFDGHLKPFYLNALLVVAVGCMLGYNVAGYMLASHPAAATNLLESMRQKLQTIRKYAVWSLCIKVLGFAGILTFFLASIQWNAAKYATLGGIAVIMVVQVYFLWKIWRGRIMRIRKTVEELSR